MDRRTKIGIGIGVLLIGGLVAYLFLFPKAAKSVDQPLGDPDATPVKGGSFQDADDFHKASGTVTIYLSEGAYFLRFENYAATDGPDVYFYLTPTERADTRQEVVEEGLFVPVPGGANGDQATLRGNFNVPLPDGFEPSNYRGISIWCRNFSTLFGYAVIS